ncbi:MAG: 3-oxoacyl-ACP reductase FabG [Bacteroidota bacterium]
MRLENKIAIVTGGARGIGEAICEQFVKEGARVIIWDLLDQGQEVADRLGPNASFMKLSITSADEVNKAVDEVRKMHGRIDILINNAGITRDRTLLKMSEEEWDLVIDVNLKGLFLVTKAVASIMKEQKYGRIVSAASNVGIRGNYGQTNYVATKSGVIGMTKTWALELGRYGITANCIAPGYTLTPMTEKIPDNIKEMAITQIPVGFIADPVDIAHGYVYLASDEARFISGVCLPIDGGTSR